MLEKYKVRVKCIPKMKAVVSVDINEKIRKLLGERVTINTEPQDPKFPYGQNGQNPIYIHRIENGESDIKNPDEVIKEIRACFGNYCAILDIEVIQEKE